MNSSIEEIRKGDSIILHFEYDIIKSIELKSIQREFAGIINEIIIIPENTILGERLQLPVNQNTRYFSNKTKEEMTADKLSKDQIILADGKLKKSTFYVIKLLC